MSNELGIIVKDDKVVVSSKHVAEAFEKDHKNVLRDIQSLGCSEKFGQLNFEPVYKALPDGTQIQNKTLEYLMTRDGFTLLAMGYTGAKAMAFKEAYINAFNQMEASLKGQGMFGQYADRIPKTMSEALMLASKLEEERAALEAKVEQDAPKVLFADAVSASVTSIMVGDMAKLLKQNGVDIGQQRLFAWLRDNGYLIKSGSSKNMPTQRAMEAGFFEVKESTVCNPDGSIRITKTTKVTGKGQIHISDRLLGKRAA